MVLEINVANVDKCRYCDHKSEFIYEKDTCKKTYKCNEGYLEFDLDKYLKNREDLKKEFKMALENWEDTERMKEFFPLKEKNHKPYIHTSYIKDIILDKKISMYHTGTGLRCNVHNYIIKSFIDLIDFIYESDFEKKIKVYATRIKQADDKPGTQTEEWGILDFFEKGYTYGENREAYVKNMTINTGNKRCNVYLKKDDNSKDKLTVEDLFLYILEKKEGVIKNKQEKLSTTEEEINKELEVIQKEELEVIKKELKLIEEKLNLIKHLIGLVLGFNDTLIRKKVEISTSLFDGITKKIEEELDSVTERFKNLKEENKETNISSFNEITKKIEEELKLIEEKLKSIENLRNKIKENENLKVGNKETNISSFNEITGIDKEIETEIKRIQKVITEFEKEINKCLKTEFEKEINKCLKEYVSYYNSYKHYYNLYKNKLDYIKTQLNEFICNEKKMIELLNNKENIKKDMKALEVTQGRIKDKEAKIEKLLGMLETE